MFLSPARLLLAAAEQNELPQVHGFREACERGGRHDARLHLGFVALAVSRELMKEQIGDDEPEHGVAQELE